MFSWIEKIQRVPLVSDWVPYEIWMSRRACLTTSGAVVAAYEVEGIAFETLDAAIVNKLVADMNGTWRNIATNGLMITRKLHHGFADYDAIPPPIDGPGHELEEAYQRNLFRVSLYRNRLFLFVEWYPDGLSGDWFAGKSGKDDGARQESAEDRLLKLERACAMLQEQLRDYGLRRLGQVWRDGVVNGVRCRGVFNEIAEAEALCATEVWRPIGVTTGRIGDTIFSEDVTFHWESIEFRGPGYTVHAAHLGIRDYMAHTWPGIFSCLLGANFTFTLCQSFRFMEYGQAETRLTRRQNKALMAGDRAVSQTAALSTAVDEMASGAFVFGDHNLTLAVFADTRRPTLGMMSLEDIKRAVKHHLRAIGFDVSRDEEEGGASEAVDALLAPHADYLPDVANAAWRLLGSASCTVARENKALMSAWLSMLAGNWKYRVRPSGVASRNDVCMNPLYSFPIGPEKSRWGGPIMFTRTSGGTPRRIHWHDGVGNAAVGNTFVTGMMGAGKTSGTGLQAALTAHRFRKQGGGWIALDHKRGWEALIYYLGGSYMVLGEGEPCFAPLKALPNNRRSREFITMLLRACIKQDGYVMLPEENDLLALAVKTVMASDPDDRSVGEIQAFLGDRSGAGSRLRPWIWGQELGWVIDAPKDKIDLTGDINGYDTTSLLGNERARGIAVAYLFHRIRLRLNGKPLLITGDEMWSVLEILEMESEVNKLARTIRSKNGALVLLSQDPSDASKSRIAAALVGQCPNQHHYYNPNARKEHYVDGLRLTEGEYAAVERLRKGTGQFLMKKGTESSVQQIPMHGMDDWLAVVSASEEDLNALDAVPMEEKRAGGMRFLDAYHRARRERATAPRREMAA